MDTFAAPQTEGHAVRALFAERDKVVRLLWRKGNAGLLLKGKQWLSVSGRQDREHFLSIEKTISHGTQASAAFVHSRIYPSGRSAGNHLAEASLSKTNLERRGPATPTSFHLENCAELFGKLCRRSRAAGEGTKATFLI